MSNWLQTPLSECLSKVIDYRGRTPKKLGLDWSQAGYRALSANNIKFSGLDKLDSINYASEELYKKWMREEVCRGDLLLTSEAPSGQVMLWDSDEKIVLSQRLYALRVNSRFNSKFLKYYLQSPIGQKEIFRNNSGSTVAGISAKTFSNILVSYPTVIDEQERIGQVLYSLDKKIDCNNRINSKLESMAKMLYEYWFVQFEFLDANDKPYKSSGGKMVINDLLKREIPDGWRVVDLSELVDEIRDGVSPENIDSNTPYIGLEHISRKSIVSHMWSTAKDANSTKNAFKQGDILFGKIRPYFHKVWLAMMNGIASTDAIVLRPKNNELSALVLQVIFSNEFVEMASASSTGSKMPRADWKVMREYKVTLPPLSSGLLKKYQEFFDSINKLLTKNVLESNEILEMRDWLLPILMNGQVSTSVEESTQCKQS